jgi:hypothetical protein
MTPHFKRILRIHLYKIIIGLLGLFTVIAGVLFDMSSNEKVGSLLAGLATGLFVALIQYLLNWNEHADIEAVKQLGIVKVLPHRDDKEYYGNVISNARRQVWVQGNTGSRFLKDFAHVSRADSQELLSALARGIEVRFLLPLPSHLTGEDIANAESVRARLSALRKQYANLSFRYFDHRPMYSLVRVDDECLFGPIFAPIRSKDSPTIHAITNVPYVTAYLQQFEDEWKSAKEP